MTVVINEMEVVPAEVGSSPKDAARAQGGAGAAMPVPADQVEQVIRQRLQRDRRLEVY
jgi:hypothetical protein